MKDRLPVYQLDELRDELLEYRKRGLQRGAYCGFPEWHEYYSMKKGSTTYIVAPAAVGKTEFVKELMINTAQFEDWVWVLFTPETGSPKEVFADLMWAYIRKPILSGIGFESATDAEVERAMDFVNKHFYVLDVGLRDLDVRTYFSVIKKLIEKGVHVDATMIDPVTEMDIYTGNMARDLELGSFLSNVRRLSGVYHIHSVLVFHTRELDMRKGVLEDGRKLSYPLPPTLGSIAGGLQSSRKGFFVLGLWRAPNGLIHPDTGEPYPKNVLHVEVLKAKPKAIGKLGVYKFTYDPYSTRFRDEYGEWSRPLNEQSEEIPF